MIKRILIGLAGTRYTPVAIQRTVELAKQHEAEVTAVAAMLLGHLLFPDKPMATEFHW